MPSLLPPVGGPISALQSRGSLSRRLQRFLLSLPLPLPVRRAIAAVPPRLWLLLLLGLAGWVVLGRAGGGAGAGRQLRNGGLGLHGRAREQDPRLKWLDEHYDAVSNDPSHPSQQHVQQAPSVPSSMQHTFGSDGLVRVGKEAFEHPVTEILERAAAAFDQERAREVRSMAEWEEEYAEMEGGRGPPDAYRIYPLTHSHPPPLPPPLLQIFSPLPPSALSRFQQELAKQPNTFTLSVRRGRVAIEMQEGASERELEWARGVEGVVGGFARDLPDLRVAISTAPRPRHALPVTTTDILSSAHSSSSPLSPTTYTSLLLPSLSSPSQTCPPPSPLTLSPAPEPGLTFLYWPREGLDPCRHPYLRSLHAKWEEEKLLGWATPVLGFVGGGGSTDVVMPVGWPRGEVRRDRERGEWREGDVGWETRKISLFWRGPAPPDGTPHPLHNILYPSKRAPQTLLPRGRGFVLAPTPQLDTLLDISFFPSSPPSSSASSLPPTPNWDTLTPQQRALIRSSEKKHKFLLDLALEGEEHRFPEMLLSGGLVFRAGVFRSWASERSRAWVHWVPVMPDLSDLPALLLYFEANDKEARKIAEAGRRWAEDRQRQEDVEGAWFTTLVEYGRMYNKETDEDRYDY